MPNYATLDLVPPTPREPLDTPLDAPLLLALSRLHPAKGLDTLLQALAREPRAYLWIAGDGPLKDELPRQATELGVADRVRFLGWRDDRAALLEACDIVVFPSRYEPFGTVSLEAWGYKRPLVAAASDGPAGLVRDGEDALLVPIDDAAALARAITRVIDDADLAAHLVAQGAVRYEADFTEAACVQRYRTLFERLLAERKA
jgi:glycosyltransferase involved in cell wall biosynthesis